jgi:hypothetical protein
MSYQQPYGYPVPAPHTQVLVRPYRCSTAHLVIAWVCAALSLAYMLPWAIAATRNRSNVAAIALINLFLGWSLIGWVVALVMACGSDQPVVVVQNTYGPPGQQPWTQPQPWAQPQPWTPPSAPPWVQAAPWPQAPPPSSPQPTSPPALGTGPERPYQAAEPTMLDPFGNEPTQQLPRSPWEPDHRR